MRRYFPVLPALAVLLALLQCQSASTTNYAGKENQKSYTIDAAGGSYSVSLFPRTYSALAGPSFGLVLVSPVLLGDEVLYNSGTSSIVPWFNARGVSVWLVRIPVRMNLEKFGREVLPTITAAIRKNSNDESWVMGGVSLGGQALVPYLADAQRNATVSGMLVKAAFFLGTGFDYGYPGSFTRRLAARQGDGSACPGTWCQNFFPNLNSAFVQPKEALFDNAGKPVWRDNLDGGTLKNAGVRLFFLAGKIDNVAPSESVYRFYARAAGSETTNSPEFRFLLPGRMNRHSADFNHTMMVGSDALAADILPEVLRWLDL